jgi:hypothetical protein
MAPIWKRSLIALSLALGIVNLAMSSEEPGKARVVDWPSKEAQELVQSEGLQDPPGLLNRHGQQSIRQLAKHLSSNRSWLTGEVLKGLDTMSLNLNEIFAEAPEFVEVEGRLYRVLLEKVGPGWKSFGSRSRYLVFLNHEIYDKLGDHRALGFEDGKERVITEEEIEKTAAVGLTLRDITPDEQPKDLRGVVGLDSTFRLGAVRPKFRSSEVKDFLAGSGVEKSCAYISAPTACSNGVPVCATGTATPYFVLSSLLIKTDHEGAFKGDPEIELFPLRINPYSPYGGSTNVRTRWIFSGRYVTDLAGRSVYLPDVDNNNQWYSVNSGLALFPSSMSSEWASTLVDNDDTTGLLEMDQNRYNPVKKPREATVTLWPFDLFDFLADLGQLIVTLGLLNDSDDLYVQSLEVSNNLFCAHGLGQYPYSTVLTADEWDMQGYFACIDPACVPDPCAGDPCCGDPCCGSRCCGDPNCIEP